MNSIRVNCPAALRGTLHTAMRLTYVLLNELPVLRVLRAVVGEFNTGEQRRDEVIVSRVHAMFDLTVGHPGEVARFAMKCIWRDFRGWWNCEPAIG